MFLHVFKTAGIMRETNSDLSWMKEASAQSIRTRLELLFDGTCETADINTKALFRACFMKVVPKTTSWWKQTVEYGVEPTAMEVITNMPPCAEAFLFLTIETYAERIGLTTKPKTTNKRKLAGMVPDDNEDATTSGKEKMRQGGRPKAEPSLGDQAALNRHMNILKEVNKRRKNAIKQLKAEAATSVTSGATEAENTEDNETDDIDDEDSLTWHEHLAKEVTKLRVAEKGRNDVTDTAGAPATTVDGAINANKESENEDTDFMSDWLKDKCATPV